MSLSARVAASNESDTLLAWRDVQAQLADHPAKALIVFCSADHNLPTLGNALAQSANCPVLACTSAETTPVLRVMSLADADLNLHLFAFPAVSTGQVNAEAIIEAIADAAQTSPLGHQTLGLLLVDGLSHAEEWLAHALYTRLPNVAFLGGSAGDSFRFERTWVYWDGVFRSDVAVFGLFDLGTPFHLFQSELCADAGEPLVITLADVQRRAVLQINGLPAAEVYAAALGLREDQLSPAIWRKHPLMLKVGADQVARAISHVASDGALVCLSAVDTGLIATVGTASNTHAELVEQYSRARQTMGKVAGLLLIDCALNDHPDSLDTTDPNVPTLVLRSYGEQFNGQHLNASVAGLALGAGK
ncbi:MAG: hypothetical protein IT475_16190 [Aquimonas sp.]|nr:hypothetical protein [Aquimonas sp.]